MSTNTFMRKTLSLMSLEGWRNLVSDSMAIDIGSTSVIIAVKGRGVVVDEPAVVAVNKISGEAVAVGREAHEMLGRESRDVSLVYPLVDGVVADFERTQKMLDQFVRRARSGISHFSRRAVMSVLSGITQVEQRALLAAAEQAHIGRVYMVEEGLAAAIGAGVSVEDKNASGVVDIGGGTTNVAVVARGMIVYAQAERVGSFDIDEAIIDRLRRHHGLIIGAPTAETLKKELGSAIEPANPSRSLSVKGRDVQTGAPRAVEVTSEEVCIAADGVVKRLSRVVNRALAELQPEVAADIYDRGLILTGGGALLDGMAEFLQRETNLQTRIPAEPRYAIVHGLSQLFDEPLLLRRVARNEQSHMLDEVAGAFE
ncbi:MAG: rod shape-determining protein MreB [Acidobacteriota bacterium]|nr:rod shape-determining protein MreB [Acidobacteriota bacterium]MDT7777647.1 rod shape-determining protein MreB [Acidobacteriota bacterium]